MVSIKVPPLGESIVEATVGRWMKKEGEAVAAGETLVELETDKITVEVPALKAGVLTKRLKQEGDTVGVDEPLAEVDESAAGAATAEAPATKAAPAPKEAAAPKVATAPAGEQAIQATPSASPERVAAARATTGEQKVAPAARRAAAEGGVDLSQVEGTGRGGVISKTDVIEQGAKREAPREAPRQPAPTPQPRQPATAGANGARETREKMSTRRRRIAEHLLESKQATASLTTFNEIDMSAVMQLRERLRERIEQQHGVKLTYMPFFVKACCLALKDVPVLNAQIDGDAIVYKHYVNMGIAVASEQGLVVPTIKDADRKGMLDVSRDIVAIAKRARDGKLTMDDLTGGTFTITNGGVFGSLLSTPILNFPQVGILGLHKIEERPVVVQGSVQVRPMMYVALSYDHRIVDGQQSVTFLVRVKEYMEDPASMLVE